MKTYTKFKEYTWLVNTIHQAGRITLAEINRRWLLTEMSEGVEIARSTFFRHKCAIEDIFGIYIECDKKNGNKYYIGNEHVLREDTVQNWMLSTLSVGNMVSESQSLHQRILLEHVPSGGERLRKVIKAMKENSQLHITYRRYSASASKDFTIDPYCMKLFRQRWYVLGRLTNGYLSTFSLDRVEDIKQLDSKFIVPDDFDGAAYFQDSFGMLTDDKMAVERIVLRAYGYEPYYLRDLPIHSSQREVATGDDYSDFELFLRPTEDFCSYLLGHSVHLRVLSPDSLVAHLRDMLSSASIRYTDLHT